MKKDSDERNPGCEKCVHHATRPRGTAKVEHVCFTGRFYNPIRGWEAAYMQCILKNENGDCPDFSQPKATDSQSKVHPQDGVAI